jgi:hypothetical protein
LVFLWSLVLGIWSLFEESRDPGVRQRQDALLLRAVIERTKGANFLEAADRIKGVQKFRVARGQLGGFEIATAKIGRLKRARVFRGEKMEPKPAPIGPRNLLSLPKERDEKEQDEISVDARLELEVSGEILRGDLALAFLELERGMERMIDLLHERDQ